MEGIKQRLAGVPASKQRLRKSEFDLFNGSANSRSLVAEFKAKRPFLIRPNQPLRLVFATVEQFSTDGTTGNTETKSLSNDIVQQPNSADLALFKNGSPVQPDSIDYSNNTFDFTDSGSNNTLHAFYVVKNDNQIEIQRQAPKSQGSVSDILYDDPLPLLHTRNQNEEPPMVQADDPLDLAVPENYKLQVYSDGPVPIEFDDSGTANSQSTTATNAILSVPIRRSTQRVEGLSRAVRRHIVG